MSAQLDIAMATSATSVLTAKAEDWSECSSRLLIDTPDFLRSDSDWTTSRLDWGFGLDKNVSLALLVMRFLIARD